MTENTRPAPDPGRQATLGIIILMLVWMVYCQLKLPTIQPPIVDNENQANDNQPTTVANNGATPGNQPAATNQPAAGNQPAANQGTPTPQPQPTQTQRIKPRADGKWMRDPVTGEYFDGNMLYNGATDPPRRLEATDEPPAGVQTQPAGTEPQTQTQPQNTIATIPADVRAPLFMPGLGQDLQLGIVESDDFNTPKLRLRFAQRGGSLAGAPLVGFPGMSNRDHRTDLVPDAEAVRPSVPDHLPFSVETTLPGVADPNYLARAMWDYRGHSVRQDGTRKVHSAVFEFRPQLGWNEIDGERRPQMAPYSLTRTYEWDETSYLIHVRLEIRNLGDAPLTLPAMQMNGPGLFTGYFKPDEADLLYFRANGGAGVQQWVTPLGPNAKAPASQTVQGEGLVAVPLQMLLPNGFEAVVPPTAEYSITADPIRGGQDIQWAGQCVDFMVAAMFTPVPPSESQTAPRVLNSRFRAYDGMITNRDATPNSEASRWILQPSFGFQKLVVPPNSSISVEVKSFIGPKLHDELVASSLDEFAFVSYTNLAWLAQPMLAAMNFFHSVFGNWGIAIICLTLLVRGLLLPVSYWSQLKMQTSMADMKRIQPKMEKLRKKYKDKDEKQKLQAEMFKLYREENVSFGGLFQGCLLMLLQMPIWIALFGVFRYCTDFVGAEFLWISDLSKSDALMTIGHFHLLAGLPIIGSFFDNYVTPAGVLHLNILPMLVMLLMYYQTQMQQKMQTAMQTPEQAQQQKIMMGCMFIMFFFLFYTMPAGFNLYFLATSLYALMETRYIKKIVQAKVEASQAGKPQARSAN